MTKIIILGGGTAGYITALFARKLFSNASITLVESKEIGIVGVGEASTPHLVNFFNEHNIDPLAVVKETGGTIKNGINFANWNGDGKKYFHDFFEHLESFSIANVYDNGGEDFFKKTIINNNLNFADYIYQQKLAYGNKIDLEKTNYALHFDSVKLANFLESVAKTRQINIVDDVLIDPILDDSGFITKLKFKSGKELDCNFVFDCSGFARVLIGKLYKSKWKSYSSFLPAKKAIPFWLEHTQDPKPYTDSIAMKNGWMWNIPLQHRIGAGYVFDSDYISVDQAKDEIETYLGQSVEIRKIIDFDPGRFENTWIKNCLAVGLSANFLEPLESTSLWLAISQLSNFKQFINEIENPDPYSQNLYNTVTRKEADEKANFVYFHYLTKRNDSKFWQEFREKNQPPEEFKELLGLLKDANLRYYNFHDILIPAAFPMHSYLEVGHGIEFFEKKFNLKGYENIKPSLSEYQQLINNMYAKAPYHIDLLRHLQKGTV